MKKQNLIIIGVFLVLIIGFYLISCDELEDSDMVVTTNEILTANSSVNVILVGEFERTGEFKVPADWTIFDLFSFANVKSDSDISSYDLNMCVENNTTYIVSKNKGCINNTNDKININKASCEELMTLTGIGEVIANKIIEYRSHTPFKKLEDIKNVSGIGDAIYEKIKDFITI